MNTFKDLGLNESILKALDELGFEQPTDIQEQAIPQLVSEKRDLIGLAQTGTGKTAAFGLPLLENIDPDVNATQALVLAPTRELGQQIAEQLALYGKYLRKIYTLPVYGGASIVNQMRALRKTQHVIIATPGRLIDLIERNCVHLDQLKYLVLDEADEMLNMGFKDELDKILSYIPKEKNTWLFSATMPPEIKSMVNTYMTNPFEVKVNAKQEVNKNIEHKFSLVRPRLKTEALKRFVDIEPDMRGVVFTRTKKDAQEAAEDLQRADYKAEALHGDLSQAQRDRVMRSFKAGYFQLLIATDVAARGIDVNDLTHVFHFNLPDDFAYYTHRSGRTARAGKEGQSIALVTGSEHYRLNQIERKLGISFAKAEIPKVEDIADIRVKQWAESIINPADQRVAIHEDVLGKVHDMFSALTKEELTELLVHNHLSDMNLGEAQDLSDSIRHGGGGGGGGRGRGGRDRRRGDRRGGGGGGRRRDGRRSEGGGGGRRRDGGGGGGRSFDRRRSSFKGERSHSN